MTVLDLVVEGKKTGTAVARFGWTDLDPPVLAVKGEAGVVLQVVADWYGLEFFDLLGRSRREPLARARLVAMALTWRMTEMTLKRVGAIYGRHYGSVIHAWKVVQGESMKGMDGKGLGEVFLKVRDELRKFRK
jgi:hypothetical protein